MTNEPNTEKCSKCNFPASATGRQIEKARLGVAAINKPSPLEGFLRDEMIASLSTPKKIVVGASIGLAAIGLIIFRGAVSTEWTVAGLVFAAIGISVAVMVMPRKGNG